MGFFAFLHLIARYFFSISVVFSSGSASTVWPRPVAVVARSNELYTASSVASITAKNNGDMESFVSTSMCHVNALSSVCIRTCGAVENAMA
jgi:hypothetical protein